MEISLMQIESHRNASRLVYNDTPEKGYYNIALASAIFFKKYFVYFLLGNYLNIPEVQIVLPLKGVHLVLIFTRNMVVPTSDQYAGSL
jgi:hypothetical protein